jgi:FMN phosphatase YigB (HAD superfamily)
MTKIISLDFWDTLARSNPRFKEEQFKIARQYEPTLTLIEFKARFKSTKDFTNETVEATGCHPHRNELYHQMFPSWNQMILQEFIDYSDKLFLRYPPVKIEKMGELVEEWKNQGYLLYVASNTVFIHGDILSKVIFDLYGIIKSNCKFSDEVGKSKPNEAMFIFPNKPDIHVGDNVKTDGACANFGIEFLNVETLLDEHKSTGKLQTTF